MRKELVSFILPVWKPDLSQLKTCLESLVNQTYSNIEIIIAYKKFSIELDKKFFDFITQFDDNRIKIIDCKIKGVANQLNEGIKNSRGELIARIDADDFCELTRLEKQLQFKKKHSYNVVGSWGYYISNDGKKLWSVKRPVTHQEIRKKIMKQSPLLHSSVLMDKKMLINLGLYDSHQTYAQDYELWFRAMSHGYKFGNVPECLIYIRYDPSSHSRSDWKKHRLATLKIRKKGIKDYGFHKLWDYFYYLPSLFYYFISPELAFKVRKKFKNKE